MTILGQYWGCFAGKPPIYHHSISATMLYGLREGIAQIVEEGLENCIKRHKEASAVLQEGLSNLGFDFFVSNVADRLPTVTTIKVPPTFDWKDFNSFLLNQ